MTSRNLLETFDSPELNELVQAARLQPDGSNKKVYFSSTGEPPGTFCYNMYNLDQERQSTCSIEENACRFSANKIQKRL